MGQAQPIRHFFTEISQSTDLYRCVPFPRSTAHTILILTRNTVQCTIPELSNGFVNQCNGTAALSAGERAEAQTRPQPALQLGRHQAAQPRCSCRHHRAHHVLHRLGTHVSGVGCGRSRAIAVLEPSAKGSHVTHHTCAQRRQPAPHLYWHCPRRHLRSFRTGAGGRKGTYTDEKLRERKILGRKTGWMEKYTADEGSDKRTTTRKLAKQRKKFVRVRTQPRGRNLELTNCRSKKSFVLFFKTIGSFQRADSEYPTLTTLR